jgi:hypothetical protein
MRYEPSDALAGALDDDLLWIRLGAALAAPGLTPGHAAALLAERIGDEAERGQAEEAIFISALAQAGGDYVPALSRFLDHDREHLATLLQVPDRGVAAAHDRWVELLRDKVAAGRLKNRVANLLVPLFGHSGSAFATGETAKWTEADRAQAAYNSFQHYLSLGSGNQEHAGPAAARLETGLAALRAGRLDAAIQPLVGAALTVTDPWVRWSLQKVMPRLGTAASAQLLKALAGEDGPRPDADAIRVLEAETSTEYLMDKDPEAVAAFLAAEALEKFEDIGTVQAVTDLYLGGHQRARARAARVLAHMSSDVMLPSLLWSAGHLPSARERSDAIMLVEGVIGDKEAFGLDYHRVGQRLVEPEALQWVLDVNRGKAGDWFAAPGTALPILQSAIGVVPDMAGEVGIFYSKSGLPNRANAFSRAVRYAGKMFSSPPPLPPVDRILFPHTDLPEQCPLEEEIQLSVWLDPVAAGSSGGPVELPFAKGEEAVDLVVLIHAGAFETSPDFGIVRVPREGASSVARFKLKPRCQGAHAIDVKFLLGTRIVGHCAVVTRIGPARSAAQAAITHLEPVSGAALEWLGDASALLRVETEPDGRLHWRILEPNSPLRDLGCSAAAFGKQEIAAWTGQQAKALRDAVASDLSPEDMDGVLSQLAARGQELLGQVGPRAAIDALAALPDESMLVVESDADWLSWELLAGDDGDLLGERHILVRAPLVTEPPEGARTAPPESPALSQAALVVGDEIKDGGSLRERTFDAMADRVVPFVDVSWSILKGGVADKDIVHFICHGRSEPSFHLSYGAGPGRQLVVGQVGKLGIKPGAVVFANACRSATPELMLSEFQSFGRAFYLAGARPFIGTLAPVPQSESIEFAALFYRHFAVEGLPAGFALREARREARESFKVPVWLFYCLYGSSLVRRRWQ